MMKCLIIEDELAGQEILKLKLKNKFPDIEILRIINNKLEAISYLREHANLISFVFLDIEIKGGTGIEILEAFPERKFDVIFTTAYQEYALDGYQFQAIHYLLKPFNDDDFCEAINRVIKKQIPLNNDSEIYFFHNEKNETIKINFTDILFCKSDGAYTEIYLENKKFVSSKNIGEIEKILDADLFARVHHSFIINKSKIEKIEKTRNGIVTLKGKHKIPVSQRKLKDFLDSLANPNLGN